MFKKVLYPIDVPEGGLCRDALDEVVEEVRKWGATLYLIYVLPGFNMPLVATYFPKDAEKKARAAAKAQLDSYIQEHIPEGLPVVPVLRQGTAYEEILAESRKHDVDLIIIPGQDHPSMEKWLLGTTTSKVVRHAHCSVLVLRHCPEREKGT